jgi:hypothetical protein
MDPAVADPAGSGAPPPKVCGPPATRARFFVWGWRVMHWRRFRSCSRGAGFRREGRRSVMRWGCGEGEEPVATGGAWVGRSVLGSSPSYRAFVPIRACAPRAFNDGWSEQERGVFLGMPFFFLWF